MHPRVGEQVDHDLTQLACIRPEDHRFLTHLHPPRVVGSGQMGVHDRFGHHRREVDVAYVGFRFRVQPREQQQVFDERGHPHRLRLDAVDVPSQGRGCVVVAALRELGVSADGGQRRSELVTRIRDEGPHFRLGGLTHGQRVRHVPEQAVERRPDLADLAAGLDVLLADPHRLGNLATVERELGDGGCGGRDMLQRTQRSSHAHCCRSGRQQKADDSHDADHEGELVDRPLQGGERQPGDEHRPVVRGRAFDAVRAEPGQRDRAWVAVAGNGAELCLHGRRQLVLLPLAVGESLHDEGAVDDDGDDGVRGLPGRADERMIAVGVRVACSGGPAAMRGQIVLRVDRAQ